MSEQTDIEKLLSAPRASVTVHTKSPNVERSSKETEHLDAGPVPIIEGPTSNASVSLRANVSQNYCSIEITAWASSPCERGREGDEFDRLKGILQPKVEAHITHARETLKRWQYE